jgi:hypothetical protein
MRRRSAAAYGQRILGESMELAQVGLLLIGWVVAFLLGKELQAGFLEWRRSRHEE